MLQLFAAGSELFVDLKPMPSDGILQKSENVKPEGAKSDCRDDDGE
jgi:hypothetical protein